MPRAHDHGDAGMDTSYFPQKAGDRAGYTDPAPGCHKAQGTHTVCPLPARRLLTTLCFLQSHSIACSGVFTVSKDSFAISSKCSPHSLQPKKVFTYPRITCSTALGSPSKPVGKESSWSAHTFTHAYSHIHSYMYIDTHLWIHTCTFMYTDTFKYMHICTEKLVPKCFTECKEK